MLKILFNKKQYYIVLFLWTFLFILVALNFSKKTFELSAKVNKVSEELNLDQIASIFKDEQIVGGLFLKFNQAKIYFDFTKFEYLEKLQIEERNKQLIFKLRTNSSNDTVFELFKQHLNLGIEKFNLITIKQFEDQIINIENLINSKDLALKEINEETKKLREKINDQEIYDLVKTLQQESATYTAKHPRMVELYTKVKGFYRLKQTLVPSYEELLRINLATLEDPENILKNIDQLQNNSLMLTNEINELNKKLEKFKTQSVGLSTNIDYIKDKIGTFNLIKDSFIYSTIFMFIIILVAYLRTKVKNTFSDESELKEKLDIKNIYNFPKLKIKKVKNVNNKKPIYLIDSQEDHNTLEYAVLNKEEIKFQELQQFHRSEDDDQKNLEMLASELAITAQGERKKIFLISSASKNIGNSTVVSNLAIAFAKISKKVLVVDANFINPSLEKVYNISPSQMGLSEYLLNLNNFNKCIVPTDFSGLYLMPSGNSIENALKLYSSEKLNKVIKEFSKKFNFVIVDLGSILDNSSASFIASTLGAVYLVVNSNSTTESLLKKALAKLDKIKVKTEGIILNKVNL